MRGCSFARWGAAAGPGRTPSPGVPARAVSVTTHGTDHRGNRTSWPPGRRRPRPDPVRALDGSCVRSGVGPTAVVRLVATTRPALAGSLGHGVLLRPCGPPPEGAVEGVSLSQRARAPAVASRPRPAGPGPPTTSTSPTLSTSGRTGSSTGTRSESRRQPGPRPEHLVAAVVDERPGRHPGRARGRQRDRHRAVREDHRRVERRGRRRPATARPASGCGPGTARRAPRRARARRRRPPRRQPRRAPRARRAPAAATAAAGSHGLRTGSRPSRSSEPPLSRPRPGPGPARRPRCSPGQCGGRVRAERRGPPLGSGPHRRARPARGHRVDSVPGGPPCSRPSSSPTVGRSPAG